MTIMGAQQAPQALMVIGGAASILSSVFAVLALMMLRGGWSQSLIGPWTRLAIGAFAVVMFWRGIILLSAPASSWLGAASPIFIAIVCGAVVRLIYADLRRGRG
jgi:hypothetical protein